MGPVLVSSINASAALDGIRSPTRTRESGVNCGAGAVDPFFFHGVAACIFGGEVDAHGWVFDG